MSNLDKKIKKSVNYERNVPRCGNCISIKIYSTNKTIIKCEKINCEVSRLSICDLWKSKKGETLEG